MSKLKYSWLWRWVALAVFASVAVGCGKKPNMEVTEDRSRISKALLIFSQYRKANNKSPRNADELKTWAKNHLKADDLKAVGIDNLDEALTSPRDGQPYQVVPPIPPSPGQPPGMAGMMQTVLYEKVGVEGKHLTISGMGTVETLDDAQLQQYLSAVGKR